MWGRHFGARAFGVADDVGAIDSAQKRKISPLGPHLQLSAKWKRGGCTHHRLLKTNAAY